MIKYWCAYCREESQGKYCSEGCKLRYRELMAVKKEIDERVKEWMSSNDGSPKPEIKDYVERFIYVEGKRPRDWDPTYGEDGL